MPFKSKQQMKKCYALKAQGKAKGWDCEKWAKETPKIKSLPKRAPAKKKK